MYKINIHEEQNMKEKLKAKIRKIENKKYSETRKIENTNSTVTKNNSS